MLIKVDIVSAPSLCDAAPTLAPICRSWFSIWYGGGQAIDHVLRQPSERSGIDVVADQQCEFIATEPRADMRCASQGGEPIAHCNQQFVAKRMPKPVIDSFETVKIDQQQGGMSACLFAAPRSRFQRLDQHHAIRQAGQHVMASQPRQPRDQPALMHKVQDCGDQSGDRQHCGYCQQAAAAQPACSTEPSDC